MQITRPPTPAITPTVSGAPSRPTAPTANPLVSRPVQKDPAIAAFAASLIEDNLSTPRTLFLRILNAADRSGGRKVSKRSERTATEILHFLFRCHLTNKTASVSDVYLSTGLARGTAIRCIANLRAMGVIETVSDRRDKRRSLVQFTKPYQRVVSDFSEAYFHRLRELLALAGITPLASSPSSSDGSDGR